ncbi:cytidine deaminase [Siculibacillus lacustris]|uniref:Cytidine deaminase n=1 Tax=Siculibacillus lacustris TaxID=1549641 RepID=A0A4Q9VTG9_9HYPH|nr:cytidine deaminase [Siculibacillus lacustris]TBW39240.1 cytidine deaminase [Siculibacillus lacustris]
MTHHTIALDTLFEAAADVRVRAHAPYSGFFVGAAVVDGEGRIHVGCNVENAAYPEGVCAEAGAISAMVAAGGRHILAVAVVGGPAEGDLVVCPPCGGCRQKIREFARAETTVHLKDAAGAVTSLRLEDLLPISFGPEHL